MRRAGNLIALILAVAIVYLIIRAQYPGGPDSPAPPKEQIDVMGVRGDLLSMAQAERLFHARHGRYATLEELEKDGFMLFPGTKRRGYSFVAEVDEGRSFTITASPADRERASWPTLSIDETLVMSEK